MLFSGLDGFIKFITIFFGSVGFITWIIGIGLIIFIKQKIPSKYSIDQVICYALMGALALYFTQLGLCNFSFIAAVILITLATLATLASVRNRKALSLNIQIISIAIPISFCITTLLYIVLRLGECYVLRG